MARKRHDEPEDDEEPDDSDWGDDGDDYDPDDPETYPSGLYDDDGPPTVPCPHCREDILEDSEQCPHCGEYISKEDTATGTPWSTWLLLVLMLLAVGMWILGRG